MDYKEFKAEILKLFDINLDFYKEKQMKRRIDSLISKNKYNNYRDYVQALKGSTNLFSEFLDYITINVSEFYRNPEQWDILGKEVIPLLFKESKEDLKIWSAACSTGEEPYTLVMVLNRHLPFNKINILATDIDNNVLKKAKEGIYSSKSIEKLPQDHVSKYFIKEQHNYRIKDEVKNCVNFKQHDLLKDDYPKGLDLIVCRNVFIYFTEEAKNQIYEKFNKSLKTGGILFVGSTEQILSSAKYGFRSIRTFFYKKERDI